MSALDSLTTELGAPPPPAFKHLPDHTHTALAALLHDARVAQAQALAQAVDDGLRFVPRPLRGVVAKVVMR